MTEKNAKGFSSVDRALILLSLARPTPDEKAALRKLLMVGLHWQEFRDKVSHNDIGPMVHLSLQKIAPSDDGKNFLQGIPPDLLQELKSRYTSIAARNQGRWDKACRLFSRLAKAGVEVIILKGGLFAENIYGDVGYKKMNDLDLLVKFADLEALQKAYREEDLFPLALLEGGEEISETKGYHLPAYVSRDLGFVLGTHWNLCNPKQGYAFDCRQLWERSTPVRFGSQTIRSLSPADVLHHLIVHFHYYKTGLKELADFANWIRAQQGFDWKSFLQEIEQSHTWTPAFRTLTLVNTLFDCGIPKSLLETCRRKAIPWVARDTCRQAFRQDLLLGSRSVYGSEIEKAYLAFSFENAFSRKLPWFAAFWQRLLFPPCDVLYRTNFCAHGEQNLFWLWVMNLIRTAREVGKSYGMAIFFLLMLKSGSELLGSLFGAGEDRMAALRQELGADDQRIRQLMDSMD